MTGLATFIILWATFAIVRPQAVGTWLARVDNARKEWKPEKD